MSRTSSLLSRGMLMVGVVIAIASISVAYGALRTTSEVPAQLVGVEASYQLGIYDFNGNEFETLDFGQVVAGNPTRAGFTVVNQGNTYTRLGFRIRYGDQIYEAVNYGWTGYAYPSPAVPGVAVDPEPERSIQQEIEALHQKREDALRELGPLNTPEKREEARRIQEDIDQSILALEKRLEALRQGYDPYPSYPYPVPLPYPYQHQISVPGLGQVVIDVEPMPFPEPYPEPYDEYGRYGLVYPDYPAALAPEQQGRVMVTIYTAADLGLGEQNFAVLVDGHDLEPAVTEPPPPASESSAAPGSLNQPR